VLALFGGAPTAAQVLPGGPLAENGPAATPGNRPEAVPPGPPGRALYYHKPAGAPTPVPGVPVSAPEPGSAEIAAPGFVLPANTSAAQPPADPPVTSTSQKRQEPYKDVPVDPTWTQLPPRSVIFAMYDDPALEKLIGAAVRADIERRTKDDKERAPLPPVDDPSWRFPTLAAVREKLAPPGTTYQSKTINYPPWKAVYEPNYVAHRRLHFEELNSERYGWDLGFIQPFVSAGYFYKDTLFWPQSLTTGVIKGPWDTSAGKCLPGSPVPYYLYPPGLTITGSLAEAAIVTGVAIVIP
jgi:hypothetical protein